MEAVNPMEACSLTNEGDSRLALATAAGETYRVDAIRLRRPRHGEA